MAKVLQDVLNRLQKIEHDIETIELGVYGDSKNEIKGLIQSVRDLQISFKKLQEQQDTIKNKSNDRWKKVWYFLSGATTVIGIIWAIIKWITSL